MNYIYLDCMSVNIGTWCDIKYFCMNDTSFKLIYYINIIIIYSIDLQTYINFKTLCFFPIVPTDFFNNYYFARSNILFKRYLFLAVVL